MPDRPFRPLADVGIAALSDEQILEYVIAARERGELRHATRALQILVWGYRDIMSVRVARKVPVHDVQDVADAALLRAVASALRPGAFVGGSMGEFRSWAHTVVDRQVADYWRKQERSVTETALPDEHQGEDDVQPTVAITPDAAATVDVQAVIDQARDELGVDHRRAVDLHVFESRSAREAATTVGNGMSEGNVHQIATRFRRRMRELLEEAS